ncbi:MAG TPA: condensation domain-containing protein, partial [Candidatus Binatia bacterium]|nr:condensation domain-containing protein [Candidatus Binatia bacterium]
TGKVARVGLAQQLGLCAIADAISSETDSFEVPRTNTEIALAGIWQSLIRQERIGRFDNFFRLGGDSLVAAQIISRIQRDLKATISPVDFFDGPTVAELAARIDGVIRTQTTSRFVDLEPVPRGTAFQLSFAQRALWFLDQLEPDRWLYNRSEGRRFAGVIDLPALEQSLNQIVHRHEALRTCFPLIGDVPMQVIAPAQPITLSVIDLCHLPNSEFDIQVRRLAREEARRPFDLACGPMLRATVFKGSAADHVLVITMHHIASDGWSSMIFWNELAAHYNAITAGTIADLPRLPIQYVDYGEWQHRHLQGERLERLQSYWKQQVGSGRLPQLRFFKEPVTPAGPGERRVARRLLRLPRAITQGVRILAATEDASLFMGLLAALKALLYRYTGQTDIVVGTLIAGRNAAPMEGVIGNFANLLPVRANLGGNPTFRILVKRVRGVTLQTYEHDDLPLSMLADILRARQTINLGFPFEVMVNLRNFPSQPTELTGLNTTEFRYDDGMVRCPLSLEVIENADGLSCIFEFDTDRVDKETMERIPREFQALLEAVVADPDQPIDAIRFSDTIVLGHMETSRPRAAVDDPSGNGIPHGFEAQAEPKPDAPAVSREGIGFSSVNSDSNAYAFPLSFAQQRLWFLHQLDPKSANYNISAAFRLNGNLDIAALQQSFDSLIQRHEALRTSFSIRDGEPMQIVHPASPTALSITDLRHVQISQREHILERHLQDHASQPFDLDQGPLFRIGVIKISKDEHVLHLSMHHIISDGWSMGVLFKELAALYSAHRAGKSSPLPDLPIQYADYAIWQRDWLQGENLDSELSYWRKQLDGLSTLQLPTDHPRPPAQTYRGSSQSMELAAELSQALKGLSQREGVTLYMTLLAAFQTLLCRYCGQQDIVVGSPIAGRNRQETEGLIGFLVNTLLLRADLSNNPSFRQLLTRVRQVALDAYDHQEIPFEKLVEELKPDRSLTTSPLFQV